MLTVDFDRLDVGAGTKVIDVGCGAGRHTFEAFRRGADVVGFDQNAADLNDVDAILQAMKEQGEAPASAVGEAVKGDALDLPYPDATFDCVIASEILEHVPEDDRAIAELVRVLKPGGALAITVPRWLPERICWALSDSYHANEGGHIRIYRADELRDKVLAHGLRLTHTHHAHALHSPYWWLKCAVGTERDSHPAVTAYHKMLVWDMMSRPWLTRTAESVLNPVIGKSVALYFTQTQLMADVPHVAGVFTPEQCLQTAESIAATQESSGAIPWSVGGHTDPWDHVENAMALTAAGLLDSARAAYEWSRVTQRPDGSWPIQLRDGIIEDPNSDSNFCAYIATGVWHHVLITGDRTFAESMWPVVAAAIDFVLSLQKSTGEIAWAAGPSGSAAEALLTGCSSIHHSIRCALALADYVGEPQPEWEIAVGRLGHAIAEHPEGFVVKDRWSMEWYYPVLGGAIRGRRARARIDARWQDFVVPGLGIRCVDDRPWVTGAETCELVLALEAMGDRSRAHEQFTAMHHLREEDGSYWTGLVYDDGKRWPVERTTWTGAAVILAADALSSATPGSGIFRGTDLPRGLEGEYDCECATSER